MNHGGLYGRANEQNFPNANDYRNIVVAEAMKVLGFVNRHSRGVLMVQKELKANENGEALLWTSQGLKFVTNCNLAKKLRLRQLIKRRTE